jgi:diacylglycerol kinase family enzyme
MIEAAGHRVVRNPIDDPSWTAALEESVDLVAIAGGDGTVATVLCEIADSPRLLVTVLPLGSANNIAHVFGLVGHEPEELIGAWERWGRRRYVLGRASGPGRDEIFVETIGGGLFAESISRALEVEHDGIDKVQLGLEILRQLIDEIPARPWTLTLDGTRLDGTYLAVEAMLVGMTGPNVLLAPDADPGDPFFDLVLIDDGQRSQLSSYLDQRLRGRSPRAPELPVRRGQSIKLAPTAPTAMRIDDTPWPSAGWSEADRAHGVMSGCSVDVLTPPDEDR